MQSLVKICNIAERNIFTNRKASFSTSAVVLNAIKKYTLRTVHFNHFCEQDVFWIKLMMEKKIVFDFFHALVSSFR